MCSTFSVKAGEYLHEIDANFYDAIAKSGIVGILQDEPCQEVFPECPSAQNSTQFPDSYRHPDINNNDSEQQNMIPLELYQKLVKTINEFGNKS